MAETDDKKRFTYTATNRSTGVDGSGTVRALDQADAARQLRKRNLAPLTITEGRTGLNAKITFKKPHSRKVKAKDLAVFAKQFSSAASAGLPLLEILTMLAKQSENAELRRVLPQVIKDVTSGQTLTAGLSKHPHAFPPLMIHMIRAGESGSGIANALSQVALSFEKDANLRSKVRSAMAYPVIVLSMAAVMVGFMMIFVIPTFENTYQGMGAQLPGLTLFVIALSHAAPYAIPIMIVASVLFGKWWSKHKNDLKVRQFVDPLKLKLPILGTFTKQIVMARFARVFSSLLESGVSLSESLEISGKAAGNVVVSDAVKKATVSIKAGQSLSASLATQSIFESAGLLISYVSNGEKTGDLVGMLTNLAVSEEANVEETSDKLSTILEPFLIVILGVVIGVIMVALYLPIFDVASHI